MTHEHTGWGLGALNDCPGCQDEYDAAVSAERDRRIAEEERAQLLLDVARAAMIHAPETESLLPYACYQGNCDHGNVEPEDCPEVEVAVCGACFALAAELQDEYVPDEVLAENCPVCVAVMASGYQREAGDLDG